MAAAGMAVAQGLTSIGNWAGAIYQRQKAEDWQEYVMKHRYQWLMKDLKAAGINPMFAFGSGGAQPGAGGVIQGATPAGSPNYAAHARNIELLKAERQQVEEIARLKSAEADSARHYAHYADQVARDGARKAFSDAESAYAMSVAARWEASLRENSSQHVGALAEGERLENMRRAAQLRAIIRQADFDAGDFKYYMRYIDQIMKSGGGILGGALGGYSGAAIRESRAKRGASYGRNPYAEWRYK